MHKYCIPSWGRRYMMPQDKSIAETFLFLLIGHILYINKYKYIARQNAKSAHIFKKKQL